MTDKQSRYVLARMKTYESRLVKLEQLLASVMPGPALVDGCLTDGQATDSRAEIITEHSRTSS